jgi:hypothetical protein
MSDATLTPPATGATRRLTTPGRRSAQLSVRTPRIPRKLSQEVLKRVAIYDRARTDAVNTTLASMPRLSDVG